MKWPAPGAWLARAIETRPTWVLLLGLAAILPLVPFVRGVPLDNSLRAWMVDEPTKLAIYDRFLKTFGTDERIVAVVKGPRGDEASLLRFVHDLGSALGDRRSCPQVEDVVSIETVSPDEVAVLLDDELGGWGAFPRLEKKLTRSPLNRDFKLLDLEHGVACVGVGLRPGAPDARRALLAALRQFRERASREGRELLLAGQPIVNVELDEGAREVESRFMPILVATCVVAMLLLTRSVRVTALVLVPVGVTLVALIGFVGVTGHSFNLLLVIAKPLTFVLALATGLHFAQSYLEGLREGMDRKRAALRALDEKGIPCVFTTISAVYGFGSLVTARVTPIRDLGGFAAAGILVACWLMLGPLLAALACFGPSRPPEEGPDRFGTLAEAWVRWIVATRRRALTAVVVGLALCGVGVAGYRALRVETNALSYFKPDHPIRREYAAIEDLGYGLFSVEMVVRARDGVAIATSATVLERLRAFETVARLHTGVTGALSLADVLVDGNWRAIGKETLPDSYILGDAFSSDVLVEQSKKLMGDGEGSSCRALRVSVFARTLETKALIDLIEALRRDFERTAGPGGLEAEITGSFPLMLETQLALVDTLASSLLGAALTIGLTILVFVRSLRRALLAIVPNALAILLGFALMWATSIPLDVGTVMVSSIVLGIAVDNTIHYFFHYGRALRRGQGVAEATATAARIAGRSLVLATAITVIGFLTLLPSSFAPTWRFGLLASFGLTVAVFGTLAVLPALLVIVEGRRT